MKASQKELFQRLSPFFIEYNNINAQTPFEYFEIEAKKLVLPGRLDLIPKILYIESKQKGQDLERARQLYAKHIEAFTDGTYSEYGNQQKNSLEKYFETFDALIESFKTSGFDPKESLIPVDADMHLLDGAHRVACAWYFNCPVHVVRFPTLSVNYDAKFFRQRCMDEEYLHQMVLEYAIRKDDVRLWFVWPKAVKHPSAKEIPQKLEALGAKIVFEMRQKFTHRQMEALIYSIYKQEHWIGHYKNGFQGIQDKVNACYAEHGYVHLYVVEGIDARELNHQKAIFREKMGLEKGSIHTADTKKETDEILTLLLSKEGQKVMEVDLSIQKHTKKTWINSILRRLRHRYRVALIAVQKLLNRPV